MIPILARAFFASKDTKTPTIISLVCIFLNIGLLLYFISIFGHNTIFEQIIRKAMDLESIKDISVLSIALSTAISSTIQAALLLFFLEKKKKGLLSKENWNFIFQVCVASFFLVISAYAFLRIFGLIFNNKTVLGLLLQTVSTGFCSIGIYFIIGYILKIKEISELKEYFVKRFAKKV